MTKHFDFLDLFLRVIVDRIIKILHVRIIVFLVLRNCYNNCEVLATADINSPELGKGVYTYRIVMIITIL